MQLFGDVKGPLADRLRPKTLKDYVGQPKVVGEGTLIRRLIEQGKPASLILWGPPGSGKTTLARIIAATSHAAFEEVSAVTSGLPEVKKVIERGRERRRVGQATILFVDEIHRFNKAQQDAFLPVVENGTIYLIGATTENPSFEVIGPLRSRSRLIVLEPLDDAALGTILAGGVKELGLERLDPDAEQLLVRAAAGDARSALGALEAASELGRAIVTKAHVEKALEHTGLRYDKTGEAHYDFTSAFIKSLRASDVDAALFYLARMMEGGEDPAFIARRMVIFASEDIGVARPDALPLAVACAQGVERIGMPEGRLLLAHTAVELARSPKSRAAYDAIGRAIAAAKEHPGAAPPKHLRNPATSMMRELGYGEGYQWEADFSHPEGNLPPELRGQKFYDPDRPQTH